MWLDARRPVPPDGLRLRIDEAVSAAAGTPGASVSESFVRAAKSILVRLADSGGAVERATAIDLLAADALITYALEAAAEDCESFAAQSDAAMASLAEISAS